MRILITGGGVVGSTLAAKLAAGGHDVALVESDPVKARELDASIDAQVVVGDATLPSVLRRAGAEEADLLLASTRSDSHNVIVGVIATSVFEVPRVVVRIREPEHAETFLRLTRDRPGERACVNPESAAVDRILNLLAVPKALDVVPFLDGQLLVAGFRILPSSDFVGLTLAHLNLMFPDTPTLAAAIHRGNVWIVPHGEEEIRADDVVYFAIPRTELEKVLLLIGALEEKKPRLVIAGATRLGLAVAKRLEADGRYAVLIEPNAERARAAAEQLSRTIVVHGSATDHRLLEEEEIERVATFVAATDDHEENLVSGLLAKRLGASRAFALVDNPALANLIGEVGIDAVISPRLLAVGLILQRMQRGRVLSIEALLEDQVEIIEAEAVEGSRLTGEPLADLDLPAGVVVAGIRRNGRLLVPAGDTRISPADRVLLVTMTRDVPRLEAFLSA